jgi:FkbM family methyltransferase
MYFVKGKTHVKCNYFSEFRAYEFVIEGKTLLSSGAGWAFTPDYLKSLIADSYNFYYMPLPGDCVVDLGAGLGEESIVYSLLVGPSGKVHAMEANARTYAGLKYLADKNNYPQLIPYNLAIYNKDEKVTIEDDEENYLTNTINTASSLNSVKLVQGITFDQFVIENGIDKIDFMKSNVEGAEQFLIEGMKNSVSRVRNLCISCHDFRHRYHDHGQFYMTKEKIVTFLKDNGFEITIRNTGNRVVDDYVYGRNLRFKS